MKRLGFCAKHLVCFQRSEYAALAKSCVKDVEASQKVSNAATHETAFRGTPCKKNGEESLGSMCLA